KHEDMKHEERTDAAAQWTDRRFSLHCERLCDRRPSRGDFAGGGDWGGRLPAGGGGGEGGPGVAGGELRQVLEAAARGVCGIVSRVELAVAVDVEEDLPAGERGLAGVASAVGVGVAKDASGDGDVARVAEEFFAVRVVGADVEQPVAHAGEVRRGVCVDGVV